MAYLMAILQETKNHKNKAKTLSRTFLIIYAE